MAEFDYSPILSQVANGSTQNHVFPTVVNSGVVSLYLNDSFKSLQIVNMEGRILQTQMLSGNTGRIDGPLNTAARGHLLCAGCWAITGNGILCRRSLLDRPSCNKLHTLFIETLYAIANRSEDVGSKMYEKPELLTSCFFSFFSSTTVFSFINSYVKLTLSTSPVNIPLKIFFQNLSCPLHPIRHFPGNLNM